MRRFKYLILATLVLISYQNCSPPQHFAVPGGNSSSSNDDDGGGAGGNVLAEKFSQTLQPLLRANCAGCHGVSQVPKFAVASPEEGSATIMQFQLADLTTPANSKFVTKIAGGHNGFAVALSDEIRAKIQAWSDAMGGAVDVTPPSVMISFPAANAQVGGAVAVQAVAADDKGVVGVQFFADGVAIGTEDLAAPYSVSWNVASLPEGLVSLTARARDAAGNVKTSDAVTVEVRNVVVVPDTTAPVVALAAPAAGATVSAQVTVTATATDNIGVVGVQFLVNGAAQGAEDTAEPYSLVWNTGALANGTYTLTARARDAAGNMTVSAARTVTVSNAVVDATAPVVALSAPAAGATVSGQVTMTATATDNIGVVGVQFLVNGAVSGAEDTAAPYSVVWNTTAVANGTYTLTARARDAAGNMTVSAAGTVTVSNVVVNPDATYANISATILGPRCLGCHGAVGASAGVRFDTYANTLRSVRAGNPAGSVLYTSVAPGGNMPPAGGSLSAAQVKAISDWITAGALNN